MKIVITGSLGYVSKPLTQELVEKGHSVTVISHSAEKRAAIEAMGATAAIGSMEDVNFLTAVFTGADAVYCMMAPGGDFADPNNTVQDVLARVGNIAHIYVQAIRQSGVKRVVYLSSIGAHTDKGNGLIAMHYYAENILKQLPADIAITFMRPVGFYKNLFSFIHGIKTQGVIASNYGAADRVLLVSSIDIAAAIVEELTSPVVAQKVRYIASEDLTCNEVATILGTALGKPDLKWIIITDERLFSGYKAFGMNASFAESFVQMNASTHNGKIYEDYDRHKPVLGKAKLAAFAQEFAAVYHQ